MSGFGGAAQYILQGPTEKDKSYVALQGLVVEIKIIDAIKISPLSGLSPTNGTANRSVSRSTGSRRKAAKPFAGSNTASACRREAIS
jgi:hypothetical protein